MQRTGIANNVMKQESVDKKSIAGYKEVNFMVMLSPDDRYRHQHIRVKGKVIRFSVQYETKVDLRFDTLHGFAHRDLIDGQGEKIKTPIFARDFNETLIFAESDIKSNWKMYKDRFLRSLRDGNR